MKTDVLVIGGGVAGAATALYLARDGVEVVLAEAGDLNAGASGTNSGSLHLQIPYPEFAGLGEGWARAFAPSLRLMAASLEMWEGLGADLGVDLDVKRAGGLVVATTPEQMRRIEAKAAVERTAGVETEILDAAALRRLAPYLATDAIGGGFCAAEGKANPLTATPALAEAAGRAGAVLLTRTPVQALLEGPEGYVAETPRGPCGQRCRCCGCPGGGDAGG